MEKKIIDRVECRLFVDGKRAVAYFFHKHDAEDSLIAFRKKHGYDAIVSIQECGVEDEFVDFSERI